jgi:tRNA (guanine10-N2)-dimethyltransferase
LKSRTLLVLLSGEHNTIPEGEARALLLAYDASASFTHPESRVLLGTTSAEPEKIARRIAFARRVGVLLADPSDAAGIVRGKKIRIRSFRLGREESSESPDYENLLRGLHDVDVDLRNPDYELSLIIGERRTYLALTAPGSMHQSWAERRPRRRPFFHPSAIFPKLSRALVNFTRCKEGDVLLDPFAGTGSLPIEGSEAGLACVAADRSRRMAFGALANMNAFQQSWLGVIRADAFSPPLMQVDGIATDIPYGRASSAGGRDPQTVGDLATSSLSPLLKTGGRLVIMHPDSVAMKERAGLRLEEEHHLYIHKKLTRAITVLRKD